VSARRGSTGSSRIPYPAPDRFPVAPPQPASRIVPRMRVVPLVAVCLASLVACAPPAPRAVLNPRIIVDTDPPCCFADGLRIAVSHRVPAISERRFTPNQYWGLLTPFLASRRFRSEQIGESVQGRPLVAIHAGSGAVKVLAWSQMHGDESAASMGLVDLIAWIASEAPDPVRDRLLGAVSLTLVPMLNPDGAELFQRQNALGVDVNRDARRLSTPEGRALKALHDRLKPDFGFNLHDQNARTVAGPGGKQVGIALLAPAVSEDRGYDAVRSRARLVAARIASRLHSEIPGQVARYDDTFNPRAFGDLVQAWGTSTVLIESGALAGDPQKQRLRALNAAVLVDALIAIGEGSYADADPAAYEGLPQNRSIPFDLVVRGAQVVGLGPEPYLLDIGITFGDAVAKVQPRLAEVGDLTGVAALDTVDASGLFLHPASEMVTVQDARRWLRIGNPAVFTLRRGSDPASEAVQLGLGRR
jgi:hypothetical protein